MADCLNTIVTSAGRLVGFNVNLRYFYRAESLLQATKTYLTLTFISLNAQTSCLTHFI